MTKRSRGLRGLLVVQALLLGGFATAAAAILAAGNQGTAQAIAERRAEDLRASITQVIPPALHDNNVLDDTLDIAGRDGKAVRVYRARRGARVEAVAFTGVGAGYGGDIVVIMGVARSGELLGVRVLSHAETPGLGDKIEVAKDDWILGFAGLSLGDPPAGKWAVKKDGGHFDQFSGATITPRAVVKVVKQGLEFFAERRDELLDEEASVAKGQGRKE